LLVLFCGFTGVTTAMLYFSNLRNEKQLSLSGRDSLFSSTVISNNNWYKTLEKIANN